MVSDAMESVREYVNQHADIGSRVHHLIQYPGQEGDESKEVMKALTAWDAFSEQVDFRLLEIEHPVAGITWGKDTVGFGGTLDAVIQPSNMDYPVLIEVKTSRRLNDAHAMQAAAYAHAWEAMYGDTLEEVWVVQLGKYDGNFEIRKIDRQTAMQGFIACQTLFTLLNGEAVWDWEVGDGPFSGL